MNRCAGVNTRIGAEGNGLSQGQKQRILLPGPFIKTRNSYFSTRQQCLDANNEWAIMQQLEGLQGRTVVVVAHRLSTV
jgi:ATP-binding cassette subfamily B protein